MTQKPSIPKGTRDFSPAEMAGRNYIFDTIKAIFRKYGYSPIETPAMENLSTLLGKYGEEGDKLLFKILNSGDAFKDIRDIPSGELNETSSNALALKVSEKGLRYDLTVPFARYVVQHRNEITFPFKRYQIQPVWRADRPQKGRYREFYQCDVDVIGTESLLNELELVQIADEVFKSLDIRIRKELTERGLTAESISRIEPVLTLSGSNEEKISRMRELLSGSETGLRGLQELEELFGLISTAGVSSEVEFDLSLARGLNYYTGAIFEVKALDFAIGSICGGGRYDNLTGIFGLPDTSGVGISFGADRIYDVLLGLDKFPRNAVQGTEYLFANMGVETLPYIMKAAAMCRAAGHSAEIYPESAKLRKQFEYADKKRIKYVILAGEDEIKNNELSIKDILSGEQKKVKISELF